MSKKGTVHQRVLTKNLSERSMIVGLSVIKKKKIKKKFYLPRGKCCVTKEDHAFDDKRSSRQFDAPSFDIGCES